MSSRLPGAVRVGLLALLAACIPQLAVDEQAVIACATADDCPGGWRCTIEFVCASPETPDPDGRPPLPLSPAEHSPLNAGLGEDLYLVWSAPLHATTYQVQLARDADFTDVIVDEPGLVETQYRLVGALIEEEDQTVYWRVRADTSAPDEWGVSSFEPFGSSLHVYCPPDHDPPDPPNGPPRLPCGPAYSETVAGQTVLHDAESGNRTTPFRSIVRALAAASLYGLSEIRVARREQRRMAPDLTLTSAYEEHFTLPAGMELRGGYVAGDPATTDFADAARDLSPGNRATVRSHGAVATIAQTGIFSPTLLEGMWLESPPFDLDFCCVAIGLVIIDGNDSLEVVSNTIRGGSDNSPIYAMGALISQSIADPIGPRIEDNDIAAGGQIAIGAMLTAENATLGPNRVAAGGYDAAGVVLRDARFFSLHDLEIEVVSNGTATGIQIADSPLGGVRKSRVFAVGGVPVVPGLNYAATGILVERSDQVLLDGNAVYATGGETIRALAVAEIPWTQNSQDDVTATNNVLWAGAAAESTSVTAVHLDNATDVTLSHNTMVVDIAPGSTPTARVLSNESSFPVVNNNIFAATGENVPRVGVYFGTALRSLQNNAFVGLATLYETTGGSETVNADVYNGVEVCPLPFQVNPPGFPDPYCNNVTTFLTVRNDGNLAPPDPPDPLDPLRTLADLVSAPVGIQTDLAETLAANDWQLTAAATTAGLSAGGKDTTPVTCGFPEPNLEAWCGCTGPGFGYCSEAGVPFDYADTPRTLPVSIGAFERD